MEIKRLITFGCSFTDYSWPTWADIIALDRDIAYENWAIGGGGNQQIARRALYRMTRGFEQGDAVMIQWTSISREDRFKINRWIAEGSVALSPTYKDDFVRKYWDWNNDVINTAHSRITTKQLLGQRLVYEMAMTWQDEGQHLLADDSKLTDYWLGQIAPAATLPNHARPFGGRTTDGHPDPQWWLHWVETEMYPRFGWQLKESTRNKVQEVQDYLESLVTKRRTQSELQHLGTIFCNKQGWQFNKIKPGSDTLSPGRGSDILM